MKPEHSAFARPAALYANGEPATQGQEGLSVRAYMATEIMAAIVALAPPITPVMAAHRAVEYADALIERLNSK